MNLTIVALLFVSTTAKPNLYIRDGEIFSSSQNITWADFPHPQIMEKVISLDQSFRSVGWMQFHTIPIPMTASQAQSVGGIELLYSFDWLLSDPAGQQFHIYYEFICDNETFLRGNGIYFKTYDRYGTEIGIYPPWGQMLWPGGGGYYMFASKSEIGIGHDLTGLATANAIPSPEPATILLLAFVFLRRSPTRS